MREEGYLAIAWVAPNYHTWKKTNDQFFWRIEKICKEGNCENYYPFGLTFNSYQRENSVSNQYQYNGEKLQDELGVN